MPWNDNANPGPWGSPPGSNDDRPAPREELKRPTPAPAPSGPRLTEHVRRLRAEWDRMMRGRRGVRLRRSAVAGSVGIVLGAWALSGVYFVQPNQQAIVTRFGAFDRTVTSGLRYHLPMPIERAEVVDVANDQDTRIGASPATDDTGEGLMLTADENIVDLSFVVKWRVADPAAYLFQARDPAETVKAVAESAMREVVGRNDMSPISTNGRGAVQSASRALMQRILDRYHAGVTVDAVRIESVGPPPAAMAAYQDVARAGQDAQSSIDSANAYYNKAVDDAVRAANKTTQAAEASREQVVHEANGEASRFSQVDAQYRRAPAVVRERLYLQTMQDVLARAHTIVIGAKRANAPIVLAPQAVQPATAGTAPDGPAPQTPEGSSP